MTPPEWALALADAMERDDDKPWDEDFKLALAIQFAKVRSRGYREGWQAAIEAAAKRARTEEEPETDQLIAARPDITRRDAEAMTLVAVAAVRATKRCIAEAVEALPYPEDGDANS